ncbi:Candidapepsin-10 [Spathaspora sp. JA1]|nr:Candidapepsin-10 [Spathaspora sp. JA1]
MQLTILALLSVAYGAAIKYNPYPVGYLSLKPIADVKLGSSKDAVTMNITPQEQLFYTNLDIGSNHEQVTVAVDTGSEYLWVMDNNVVCENGANCQAHGTFATSNSNSFARDEERGDFQVAYLSGKKTQGIWGKDDVSVGGAMVHGFEFGVAQSTSSKVGIIGLNFPRKDQGYSFPKQLRDQGIISRNAYSVFLNEKKAAGTIFFGAVDHGKYHDQLVTVPVDYDENFPRIKVNGRIDVNHNGNSVDAGTEVGYIMDTGSTRSRLPASYMDTLKQVLNGWYDETWHGISFDSCSQLDSLTFYVNFYGKTIVIPAKALDYGKEGDRCLLQLNFQSPDKDLFILGMDVLRSIYFLVDLDDHEVQVAQARYDGGENIEVFQPAGLERLASHNKNLKAVEQSNSGVALVSPVKLMIMGLILFGLL